MQSFIPIHEIDDVVFTIGEIEGEKVFNFTIKLKGGEEHSIISGVTIGSQGGVTGLATIRTFLEYAVMLSEFVEKLESGSANGIPNGSIIGSDLIDLVTETNKDRFAEEFQKIADNERLSEEFQKIIEEIEET